jgi:hypothetical protein
MCFLPDIRLLDLFSTTGIDGSSVTWSVAGARSRIVRAMTTGRVAAGPQRR